MALAHHRAAKYNFGCVFGQATAMLDHITQFRTERDFPVTRLSDATAAYRHDAFNQRVSGFKNRGNIGRRGNILNHRTDGTWQRAGWYLAAHDGLDQHFLGALRILDRQGSEWSHPDHPAWSFRITSMASGLLFSMPITAARDTQCLELNSNAFVHHVRLFQHHAMIRRQVGLTLTSIDDQQFNGLVFRRAKLDV